MPKNAKSRAPEALRAALVSLLDARGRSAAEDGEDSDIGYRLVADVVGKVPRAAYGEEKILEMNGWIDRITNGDAAELIERLDLREHETERLNKKIRGETSLEVIDGELRDRPAENGGHRTSQFLGGGALAHVYKATSPLGEEVALKVARSDDDEDALPRMRREIEIQSSISHPNVMRILDHDASGGWFTMPLAVGNLEDLMINGTVRSGPDGPVLTIVTALLDGLDPAHRRGIVHRDVKPENTLAIRDDSELRWLVADWGIVRRPHGATTVHRTEHGGNSIGTYGYAAPELLREAHGATPSADVYGVARVAARVLTGVGPFEKPLPPAGPWRTWVSECIQEDALRRPQTAAEAKDLLLELLAAPAGGPITQLASAVDGAAAQGLSDAIWNLAVRHRDEFAALDEITRAPVSEVRKWTKREPDAAATLARSVCEGVSDGWGGGSDFNRYDRPLRWVLAVLRTLGAEKQLEQLQDLAAIYFPAERSADRWRVRDEVAQWIAGLGAPADDAVAHALRASGLGARYSDTGSVQVRSRALQAALGL